MNERRLISYDYLQFLKEKDPHRLMVLVINEMLMDTTLINVTVKQELTQEDILEYIVNYVTKYTLFIYYFEETTMYERCERISNRFKIMILSHFNISEEILNEMISDSLDSFRENEVWKDIKGE